ncbi:MAG: response regulator [Alphaproteobacteria bacterium]|nr:MAG: response regulator [Alphaproteobacteria bacterium]
MSTTLKHILCVDDESDILEIAKMSLEMVGNFEVHTCTSGKEALAYVENTKPDLILMDVMMPEMNGPSTLEALRKNGASSIPVVFMTAKVQSNEVAEFIKCGAIGVIPKPFDPMTLPQDVQKQWESANAG